MKQLIEYVTAVLCVSLMLSGCSDETDKFPQPELSPEGVLTEVSLAVRAKSEFTRGDIQPSEDEETVIVNRKIKLYVYNLDGKLEYENEDLQLDAQHSVKVTLKTGKKYFYVSANTDGSNNSDVGSIIGKEGTNVGFEQQILNVGFGASKDAPDLTTPNFVLSTLWGEKKEITIGMTAPVELNIGRLVAKVKLTKVEKGTGYSVMEGEFSNPQYAIGAVPTMCYWVGQYNHNRWTLSPPPGNTGGQYGAVSSAVHNAPPLIEGVQNPLFYNYPNFIDVTPMAKPMTDAFYVVENTTAKDASSQQYYGNTTHIRLKTVYTPASVEIYDAELKGNGQTLQGKTFWTVIHKAKLYITNDVPKEGIKDENTEIKKYENGVNYHRFVIKDVEQTDVEKRYSVYRNHFYEISVTGIRDLGEPTDDVDPKEPIPNEEEVATSVKVIDWAKITQIENI